jgi:hypothetical protein
LLAHGFLVGLSLVWGLPGTRSRQRRTLVSPPSMFAGLLSPGFISHSSNHIFSPSCHNRSANGRATALSSALWLRKTSQWKLSAMRRLFGFLL